MLHDLDKISMLIEKKSQETLLDQLTQEQSNWITIDRQQKTCNRNTKNKCKSKHRQKNTNKMPTANDKIPRDHEKNREQSN